MTQLAFALFLLTFIFLFQDASHSVFAQTSDDWNPQSQKGDKQETAIAYPILTDEPHTHVHQKHQMPIQRTDPPMSIPDSATIVTGNVSGIWDTNSSPYIIMEGMTIAVSDSLTIMAGVEVRFAGHDLFAGHVGQFFVLELRREGAPFADQIAIDPLLRHPLELAKEVEILLLPRLAVLVHEQTVGQFKDDL